MTYPVRTNPHQHPRHYIPQPSSSVHHLLLRFRRLRTRSSSVPTLLRTLRIHGHSPTTLLHPLRHIHNIRSILQRLGESTDVAHDVFVAVDAEGYDGHEAECEPRLTLYYAGGPVALELSVGALVAGEEKTNAVVTLALETVVPGNRLRAFLLAAGEDYTHGCGWG